MDLRKETIHGYRVVFDDGDKEGVWYIRGDLQRNEAKTLFEAAKKQGSAEFEDDYDRDWTLIYNRNDYTFTLCRRKRE